jgi:hypothetical protein
MPLLIPLIGAAVSAGGAAYGIENADATQSKMNADTANTVSQEQALQKQATPIYQQNVKAATDPSTAQQGITQALQQYNKVGQAPVSTQPLVQAPPSASVDARTDAEVARSKQASATLAQYPAQQTGWNVGNTNTNTQLGNISSIGQSIASTLPSTLALDQANGATGAAVGNLTGSVGGTVGTYGMVQNGQNTNAALLKQLQAAQASGGS